MLFDLRFVPGRLVLDEPSVFDQAGGGG